MTEPMTVPVTRGELREELAQLREDLDRRFATKAELREEVAKLATKAELHSALEIWAGALCEQLKRDAQQREERIVGTITATITAHVSAEVTRHTGEILERTQTELSVLDEKYQDIPRRLTSLEAQAHTHTEPPPKATGRRSR